MTALSIWPPEAWETTVDAENEGQRWTVSGDLREVIDCIDESTNYLVQDMLIAEGWPVTELDPEYSCFFAYVADEARAIKLRDDALRLAEGLK